jgi:hypothetical protein
MDLDFIQMSNFILQSAFWIRSLIFAQMHRLRRLPPTGIAHRRVVSFCRVYVFVAQYIRYKINIAGFLVQGGSVCAAQLMGRNFFS